jgi:thioredoxin 1
MEPSVNYSIVKRLSKVLVVSTAMVLALVTAAVGVTAQQTGRIPVPGMVTMVDLGAKSCIPCKMMAPILQELQQEYEGRAAIIFIDVWENPAAGGHFAIRVIPTQIFYDAQGQEVFRHEGFMDKRSIVAVLKKQGVE